MWRVTQLELQTDAFNKTFDEFESAIKTKMKEKDMFYEGTKPDPEDRVDVINTIKILIMNYHGYLMTLTSLKMMIQQPKYWNILIFKLN